MPSLFRSRIIKEKQLPRKTTQRDCDITGMLLHVVCTRGPCSGCLQIHVYFT